MITFCPALQQKFAGDDAFAQVFAMDGRIVQEVQFVSAGGARTINISEKAKGIYILHVEGPETDKTVKYVKK